MRLIHESEIKRMIKRKENYNETNTCDRCRKTKLYPGYAYKEKDLNGKWTGKWICKKCQLKDYNNYPDSYNNARKQLADRRTGNLDPSSSQAKGDDTQLLSCLWLDIKDLNIDKDNYVTPIDHSRHPMLGVPLTQGRRYNSFERMWCFTHLDRDRDKEFDVLIAYCISKDGRKIERIYIFPKEEVIKRKTISIYKNPMNTRGTNSIIPWYEQYRIKDEEVIVKVDDIWNKIIEKRRKNKCK